MTRKHLGALATLVLSSFAANNASATIIEFDVVNLSGNTWRYDYHINNNTHTSLNEFTIWFDVGLYEGLTAGVAPAGWDPLEIQPDPLLPHAGFYDALALDGGLSLDGLLSGFSIQFNWLGTDGPGEQRFDVVDASTFEVLESGFTARRNVQPPTGVPEPSTAVMFGAALALMWAMGTHRRRQAEKN